MNEIHLEQFALRRLFYQGSLQQRDIVQAFDLTPRTAQRRIRAFAEKYSELIAPHSQNKLRLNEFLLGQDSRPMLERIKTEVFDHVKGNALIEEFWRPKTNPMALGVDTTDAKRGFSDHSLHYMTDHLGANQLSDEVDFTELLRALVDSTAVETEYVTIRQGGCRQPRVLFPQILRVIGDQLLVNAYDEKDLQAQDDQPTLKSFVLFRFLSIKRIPQTVERQRLTDRIRNFGVGREAMKRYRITLNPLLTDDQQLVISRELGLDPNGYKAMDSTLLFAFKQHYMPARESIDKDCSNNIWPLVTRIEVA